MKSLSAKYGSSIALAVLLLIASPSFAESAAMELELELEVPALKSQPYHRPYVAVWVETSERHGVVTLALWHYRDDLSWLKDLRQWWRKLGRDNMQGLDALSGATRRPGRYRIAWDGKDQNGATLPAGNYLLNIEAVREEGGRSYQRQAITLGQEQVIELPAENELGEIRIRLQGKNHD